MSLEDMDLGRTSKEPFNPRGQWSHASHPASLTSASQSCVESHGMLGWLHVVHASWRPSGLSRGKLTKSWPVTNTAGSNKEQGDGDKVQECVAR